MYERTVSTETDPFNVSVPVYTPVDVDNVIVGQPETESPEGASDLELYGKRTEYILGIPKGDTHNWENAIVEFFGRKFRTFGSPIKGIEDLVPLSWNIKVRVERFDTDFDTGSTTTTEITITTGTTETENNNG